MEVLCCSEAACQYFGDVAEVTFAIGCAFDGENTVSQPVYDYSFTEPA